MPIRKRGRLYSADFSLNGKRYRVPLRTDNRVRAKKLEREAYEAAKRGALLDDDQKKKLFSAIETYHARKRLLVVPRTIELEEERLSLVRAHFGDVRVDSITVSAIEDYRTARKDPGIANRTINMDVDVLLRVIKSCAWWHWHVLKERLQRLRERPSDIGRALTPEEKDRLFAAAASNPEWEHVYCAAVVAANTSMRRVEVKHLRRRDVDLSDNRVTVRRSKNESGERTIWLNEDARNAFARMFAKADALGFTADDHYLWCASQWNRLDPTKPARKWDTAWRALRDQAGLPGFRFHDLRHTVITELLEAGAPEEVIRSITGQLSRRMVQHYSHPRMQAKQQAFALLDQYRQRQRAASPGASHGAQ
jgi:integrase